MIRCEVCSADNDPKLTFCGNCGHRLKPRGGRAVPPTPATGLDQARPGGPDVPDHESDWSLEPPGRRSRPSAPPLNIKRNEEPVENIPIDKAKCSECGALSPKGYRFCISCGAVLNKPRVPTARSSNRGDPGRAVRMASRRTEHSPSLASEPRLAGSDTVTCPSCNGECASGESFCKFCGGQLPKPDLEGATRVRAHNVPDLELEPPKPNRDDRRPYQRERMPQPVDRPSGKLVIIVEDGSEGRSLDLRGRQVDIGSREGDIVLPEDRYLSARHARFFRQDGQWYLRDLGSVNGVYRRLHKPVTLRHGDLVLLGLEVLQFELLDHAERGLGHAIQHGVLVFGSPAATRRARLVQRTVEGIFRDVYHLVQDETTIGRETGDIVFTSDPFMSRRHAAIQYSEASEDYVLVDLNSSNGTYLAIREDVRLEHGDFIRLGQHLFRVDLFDED